MLSDNSESLLDSVPLRDNEREWDASPAPYPDFPDSPTGVLNPYAREIVPAPLEAMNPFATEFRPTQTMFEPDLSQFVQEEPDAVASPHPFDLSQCGWHLLDEYDEEVEGRRALAMDRSPSPKPLTISQHIHTRAKIARPN